jgi:hypothetical protein
MKCHKLRSKIKQKKGQTVVEYLLVVVAIVGFAMGIYVALQKYLKGPLQKVKSNFEEDGLGRSAGTGQKTQRQYYNDVEFKSK